LLATSYLSLAIDALAVTRVGRAHRPRLARLGFVPAAVAATRFSFFLVQALCMIAPDVLVAGTLMA
jgi:hypothetical protein